MLKRYFQKEIAFLILFILILFVIPLLILATLTSRHPAIATSGPSTTTPIPENKAFTTYKSPTLPRLDTYNVYLIGDSMTHALGPRGGRFTEVLSDKYEDAFFEVSNYAQAGENIESLDGYIHKTINPAPDVRLDPLYDGNPHIIILESFGYNPLSHLGLEGGLARQDEVLSQIMKKLTERFPKTVFMFMATIAPDRDTYGKAVLGENREGSRLQADERIAYIKNHIDFANEHNIPVINVYEESLDITGDGNEKYINPDDNIHPSVEGLELMSQVMVRRISEENLFPQ